MNFLKRVNFLKRRRQIDLAVRKVIRHVVWQPFPHTIYTTGLIVQRHLAEQGVKITIEQACKRVARRLR